MTPAQIRDYATEMSLKSGINPAITLGMIGRMSSYATKFDRNGKLGLMAVPKEDIEDKAAYLANPKAQIDSGILRLAALKGDGTDIEGMEAYIGDAKAAKKALMLGLKTTTEPVDRNTMQSLYELTGSRGNVDNDAKTYGYKFYEQPKQSVQNVVQAPTQQMPEAGINFEVPDSGYAQDDGIDLVASIFGSKEKSSDTPDFVWKQLEAIGAD
jgi:hypothetical protein